MRTNNNRPGKRGKPSRTQRPARPTVTLTLQRGWSRVVIAGFMAAIAPWLVIVATTSIVFITTQTNAWLSDTSWNDVLQLTTRIWAMGFGVPVASGVDDYSWTVTLTPLLATIVYIWFLSWLTRHWLHTTVGTLWLAAPSYIVTALVVGLPQRNGYSAWHFILGVVAVTLVGIIHAIIVEESQRHKALHTSGADKGIITSRISDDSTTAALDATLVIDYDADPDLVRREKRIRETAASPEAAEAAIRTLRAVYASKKQREAKQKIQEKEKRQKRAWRLKRQGAKKGDTQQKSSSFVTRIRDGIGHQRNLLRDDLNLSKNGWDSAIERHLHDESLGIDVDERVVWIFSRTLRIPGWVISGLRTARSTFIVSAIATFVLVAIAVIGYSSRMSSVLSDLQLDWFAALMMGIGQAMFIPVYMVWAAAWMMGLGFQAGTDSFISPFYTNIGPVPQIPIFAALPTVHASWLPVVIVVLFGFFMGFMMYRRKARPDFFEHTASALVAVIALGLGSAILAALASGGIGPGRLTYLGVSVAMFTGCVVLEVGLPIIIMMVCGHPRARALFSKGASKVRQHKGTSSDKHEGDAPVDDEASADDSHEVTPTTSATEQITHVPVPKKRRSIVTMLKKEGDAPAGESANGQGGDLAHNDAHDNAPTNTHDDMDFDAIVFGKDPKEKD